MKWSMHGLVYLSFVFTYLLMKHLEVYCILVGCKRRDCRILKSFWLDKNLVQHESQHAEYPVRHQKIFHCWLYTFRADGICFRNLVRFAICCSLSLFNMLNISVKWTSVWFVFVFFIHFCFIANKSVKLF